METIYMETKLVYLCLGNLETSKQAKLYSLESSICETRKPLSRKLGNLYLCNKETSIWATTKPLSGNKETSIWATSKPLSGNWKQGNLYLGN